MEPLPKIGYDAPRASQSEDALDRWRFSSELMDLIRNTPAEWSARIGLTGKWAIGTFLQVNLNPGEATHLDLPGGGALGQRAKVRPVVTVTEGAACIASAEVYNNETKATRAVYYPPTPCSQSSLSCVAF